MQWQEAADYAASLGGRLPTEAEWEYAARGREGRAYPWGDAPPTCERAHYRGCAPESVVPVMSRPAGATPEGVHDLAGNVFEWVLDRYGYYQAEPAVDPTGPEVPFDPIMRPRVQRGGAWLFDTVYLSGVVRTSWPEVNEGMEVDEMLHIGFRVVWPGDAGPDSPPVTR